MNNIYTLTSNYINLPIGYKEQIRSFKGITELSFNLTQANSESNPIIKLDIDFNDGTEIITKKYDFVNKNKIVDLINKTFYPDNKAQIIIYFPTFFIKYLNGQDFVYQCPIKIAKSSFYSEYNNIEISGGQLIDNTENSLFVVLDNKKGDILNIKIK
jgi:hypothetical protein